MRPILVALALVGLGCPQVEVQQCADGIVCPVTQACAPLGGGCVGAEQVAACAAAVDGEACVLEDGAPATCRGGRCVAARCGDGVLDIGELCDDGNRRLGDGCNGSCTSRELCGDLIVELTEECDCGDSEVLGAITPSELPPSCLGSTNGGTACSEACVARPRCGNGFVDVDEVCDDGNAIEGDGCSASCLSDETCGNGIVDVDEECDDGDQEDLDACQSAPRAMGPTCLRPRCGDFVVDALAGEVCDDGNVVDRDGCAWNCRSTEVCGNGVLDATVGEQCDDGVENEDASDRCRAGNTPSLPQALPCSLPRCGDGIRDVLRGEACDGEAECQNGCSTMVSIE